MPNFQVPIAALGILLTAVPRLEMLADSGSVVGGYFGVEHQAARALSIQALHCPLRGR